MKKVGKRLGCGALVLVILITVFICVLKLPKTQRWNDNLNASFQELSMEGEYPSHLWASEQKWDNYTLVIFLSVLQHTDASKPILSLINLNYEQGIQENYWTDSAEETFNGDKELTGYSRYWMGSLIIMYLWLYLFPVSGLRVLFLITILLLYILMGRYYRLSPEWIALLCATLMAFWPLNGMCLVYGLDIILSLSGIVCYKITKKNGTYFGIIEYASIGALTMFFCMLSNPLITLGMVLCLHISDALIDNACNRFKLALKAVGYSAAWCLGYIVLMQLKGMLAELSGVAASGGGRLIELLGTGTILRRIETSIYLFVRFVYPWIGVWVVIVLLLLIAVCRKAYNWNCTISQWPLLMIGMYPFVWEFIFYGHTGHGIEANVYVITVFADFIVIMKSIDFRKLGIFQIQKKLHR